MDSKNNKKEKKDTTLKKEDNHLQKKEVKKTNTKVEAKSKSKDNKKITQVTNNNVKDKDENELDKVISREEASNKQANNFSKVTNFFDKAIRPLRDSLEKIAVKIDKKVTSPIFGKRLYRYSKRFVLAWLLIAFPIMLVFSLDRTSQGTAIDPATGNDMVFLANGQAMEAYSQERANAIDNHYGETEVRYIKGTGLEIVHDTKFNSEWIFEAYKVDENDPNPISFKLHFNYSFEFQNEMIRGTISADHPDTTYKNVNEVNPDSQDGYYYDYVEISDVNSSPLTSRYWGESDPERPIYSEPSTISPGVSIKYVIEQDLGADYITFISENDTEFQINENNADEIDNFQISIDVENEAGNPEFTLSAPILEAQSAVTIGLMWGLTTPVFVIEFVSFIYFKKYSKVELPKKEKKKKKKKGTKKEDPATEDTNKKEDSAKKEEKEIKEEAKKKETKSSPKSKTTNSNKKTTSSKAKTKSNSSQSTKAQNKTKNSTTSKSSTSKSSKTTNK